MTNSGAGSGLSMMRTVNGVIDQLHGSLGLADSDFFCECGHIGCKERIKLTRSEYARLRDHDRSVLVAGHAHRGPAVVALPRQLHAAAASHRSGDPGGR